MKLLYALVVASSPPDLHVSALRYTLRPNEHLTYVNPQPREFETLDARFRLADGKLTCEMKAHYSKVEDARAVIEPLLRAWEVDADMRRNRGELRFVFDGADITDRTPPPPGVVRGHAYIVSHAAVTATGTAIVSVTLNSYPDPPPNTFRLNPDAEAILFRYLGYLDGREPLASMAYFCLTVIKAKAGGIANAVSQYRIHKDVLRKLGELSSVHGDRQTARKADAVRPLTASETVWLEAAVKMLIWRVGDTRNPQALPEITMAELPTI